MWKWTLRIGLVVVLLLIVGGVVLYMNLNRIIRSQVEQQSTKSLNLSTSLDSASLAVFGGNLNLQDYKVASPPGFSSDPILSLGGLNVDVSYGELQQTPVRVKSITIDRPKLLLEHKDGKLNVKAMVDNLPGAKPTGPTPSEPAPPQQPAPEQPAPQQPGPQQPTPVEPTPQETLKLIIGQIMVKDAEVVLRPNIPGLASDIPIKIDTFVIQNVGNADNAQNGAAVKQIVTELVTTLAAKASNSSQIPQQLQALINGDLSSIAQQYIPGEAGVLVGSLLNKNTLENPQQAVNAILDKATGGAATNPTKAAQDAIKDLQEGRDPTKNVQDSFNNLFGGKKDEKKDEKKDQPKKKKKKEEAGKSEG